MSHFRNKFCTLHFIYVQNVTFLKHFKVCMLSFWKISLFVTANKKTRHLSKTNIFGTTALKPENVITPVCKHHLHWNLVGCKSFWRRKIFVPNDDLLQVYFLLLWKGNWGKINIANYGENGKNPESKKPDNKN